MKKTMIFIAISFALHAASFAQKKKINTKESISVPAIVKSSLTKKYPGATKVTWEKEKGNYEANWGGKSGEENSAQFTPSGNFIEIVKAISISEFPKSVTSYIKKNYKGAKITEAGKITDAQGKLSYEAEVKGMDILFDEHGNFVKVEK